MTSTQPLELTPEPAGRPAVVPAEPAPEQGRVGAGHLDPRASGVWGELPCGHLTPDGAVHFQYGMAEMTGAEEDLLSARGPWLPRLNQILGQCLIRLGALTDRAALLGAAAALTSEDRGLLLIALRRASLGDVYEVKAACPGCAKQGTFSVDLAALEVTPMPDRAQRTFTTALPSGRVATWHVMAPADEEWTNKQAKRFAGEQPTLILLARLDTIDGAALDRAKGFDAARAAVRALPLRDRQALRADFDAREGGVDDQVEFACPDCGQEWKGALDVAQPGFFFPSATPGR